MLRTRRMHRYDLLRRAGFLKFESYALSRVPRKTPYFKELVRERRQDLKACKKEKISQTEYENRIKEKYASNRWLRKNRAGRPVADPWHYLRDFEERWRAKFPQYESPWERKRKAFTDFIAKIERELGESRYGERRDYLKPQ